MSTPTSTSLVFATSFVSYKETSRFLEKDAFRSIRELDFVLFYRDFKLVICSLCCCSIFPIVNVFKSHLTKHLGVYEKKEIKAILGRAVSIFNTLEVVKYREVIELLTLFQTQFFLPSSFELKVLDLYSCNVSSCSTILSNIRNIKRHFYNEHKGSNLDPFFSLIKGSSLEANRFFFEIKSTPRSSIPSSLSSISNEEPIPSSVVESSRLREVKERLLEQYSIKEQRYKDTLGSFKLDLREKLSPFQIKTRYPDYINKFNIADLQSFVSPPSSKEDVLSVLLLNLKEILYLSIEKSILLNKVHLNILNSFEDNKIRNKPFKPLLTSNTRVKYFGFFATFFCFFFRALSKALESSVSSTSSSFSSSTKYFTITRDILDTFTRLKELARTKLNEEGEYLQQGTRVFKARRKTVDSRINSRKLNSVLNRGSDDEIDEDSIVEEDSRSSSSIESILSYPSFSSSLTPSNSFLFTSVNKEVLEAVRDINKSDDSLSLEIKSLLLHLVVSLLKQSTDLNIFDSPINCFFAAISIRENKSFRDTLDLSQDYSKFIYCSQLFVIEFTFFELLNLPPSSSEDLTSILRTFKDKYLNNSTNSALSEVLNNRSYCFKVNKELSTETFVTISSTLKETVLYKGSSLSVEDFKLLFSSSLATSLSLLKEELLFNLDPSLYKDINLETFSKFEDLSNNTPLSCFRDFDPNRILNSSFLRERVLSTPDLLTRFYTLDGDDLILRQQEVKAYLNSLLDFKKSFLLSFYLTTGLPLRGTELVTLRYLNSIKDPREVVLDIGSNLFRVNITYWKGQANSDKRASSVRFMSPLLSEIFLLFIVLVDPFIEFLNISTLSFSKLKKARSLVPYFFFVSGRILDSRDLSTRLSSFSGITLGRKFGIQVYRQVIITIIRSFMSENLSSNLLLEEDKGITNEVALRASLSNHTSRVEDMNYARRIHVFRNINSSLQSRYLDFCLRYFSFFNIDKSYSRLESVIGLIKIREARTIEGTLDVVNSYATRFSRSLPTSEVEPSSSLVSKGKHRRQASSITSLPLRVNKRVKTSDILSLSSSNNSSLILTSILREFLQEPNALFRSIEQEDLVRCILLRVPYLLGVLPTSIGKSLSYLLSSSLSTSKTTIVVLPLVGLKLDIARRAKGFNIPCSIYENTREFRNLTLVSLESITSTTFINSVQELIESNRLDRIILDEFHLLITSSSYRPIMFAFRRLLCLRTSFLFLTGTLPLSFQEYLRDSLKLENLTVIRASCSRPNISYRVRLFNSSKVEDRIREVSDYITSFQVSDFSSSKDKILIFCPSIKVVDLVADSLNCRRFYSTLLDVDKESTIREFSTTFDSFNSVLASTSSLEEGFDYSSIRLVIYFEASYSFLGFLQGSSRAGRDLKPCVSCFFTSRSRVIGKGKETTSVSNEDSTLIDLDSSLLDLLSLDRSLVNNYLQETTCRRRQIDLYLNRGLTEQCSIDDVACDLCSSRTSIINRQVSRVNESYSVSESFRFECLKYIRVLSTVCHFCFLINSDSEHLCNACPKFPDLFTKSKALFKRIRASPELFIADSCCFKCLLPTVLCSALKESSDAKCFTNCLFAILAMFVFEPEICGLYKDSILTKQMDTKEAIKALLRKVFLTKLDTEGTVLTKKLFTDE